MENLIRCSILWHLIWVCTVCLCPTKRTLGLYGLIVARRWVGTQILWHGQRRWLFAWLVKINSHRPTHTLAIQRRDPYGSYWPVSRQIGQKCNPLDTGMRVALFGHWDEFGFNCCISFAPVFNCVYCWDLISFFISWFICSRRWWFMNKLGIFYANQTSMRFDPDQY